MTTAVATALAGCRLRLSRLHRHPPPAPSRRSLSRGQGHFQSRLREAPVATAGDRADTDGREWGRSGSSAEALAELGRVLIACSHNLGAWSCT